jgi:hypothetical protein
MSPDTRYKFTAAVLPSGNGTGVKPQRRKIIM